MGFTMSKCTECGGTGTIALLTSTKPCTKCAAPKYTPRNVMAEIAKARESEPPKFDIEVFSGSGYVQAKPYTRFSLQFIAEINKRREVMANNAEHASEIEKFVEGMPEPERRELLRSFATGEQEYIVGGWTIGHGNAANYAT